MLPNIHHIPIKLLFLSLKIFGLAPFQIQFTSPSPNHNFPEFTFSLLGSLYSGFVLLGIVSIQSWTFVNSFSSSFVAASTERQIESVTFLVSSTIAVISVISSHIFYQDTIVSTSNDIIQVDQNLARLSYHYNPRRYNKFLVFVVLFAIGVLSFFLFVEDKAYQGNAWWGSTVVHYIFGLFMMQYVLVLKTFWYRFRVINECLRGMKVEVNGVDDLWKIKVLRRCHSLLCRTLYRISDFFAVPVWFTLGYSFLTNIISFYFIIVTVLEGTFKGAREVVVDESTWVAVVIGPVILVSRMVYNCKKVGETCTADAVHEVEVRTREPEILGVLKEFSVYLLHVNLDLTSKGLFSLDGTLIHSLFSATASYLVILLQFHQAAEEDEDSS